MLVVFLISRKSLAAIRSPVPSVTASSVGFVVHYFLEPTPTAISTLKEISAFSVSLKELE